MKEPEELALQLFKRVSCDPNMFPKAFRDLVEYITCIQCAKSILESSNVSDEFKVDYTKFFLGSSTDAINIKVNEYGVPDWMVDIFMKGHTNE